MKISREKLITGLTSLLILQIIIIFFLNFFSTQSIKSRTIEKRLINGLKKDNVVSIMISDYQDSFSVEKKGQAWFVKVKDIFLPGDTEKIDSYLDILVNLSQGVVRDKGVDEDVVKYYGFDKESSQEVVIKTANNKQYKVIIGNTGSERGSSYIRYKDEEKIREIKSFIASETSNQPIQWSDRRIFAGSFMADDVAQCDFDINSDWFNGKYSIIYKEQAPSADGKQGENFIIDPPFKPGEKKMDFILQAVLTNIFETKADDYKLDGDIKNNKVIAKINLSLKTGKSFKMTIYKAGDNDRGDYIADVDFNDYLYMLDENDVKRFVKSRNEMLETK